MADPAANQTAIDALQAMSPAHRAFQLFAGTLANAANFGTAGLVGDAGDLARGTPWGTTGGQLAAQVRSVSPVAATASDVLGALGSGSVVRAGIPLAADAVRGALAVPAVGTRAAALGATAGPSLAGTAARILGPAAAALGIGAFANGSDAPAATVAANPVDQALAQGRTASASIQPPPPTSQELLGASLSRILGNNPSLLAVQALGGLPALSALSTASAKPVQTAKDQAFALNTNLATKQFQDEVAASAAKNGVSSQAHADATSKATDKYRRSVLEAISPKGVTADALAQQAPAE